MQSYEKPLRALAISVITQAVYDYRTARSYGYIRSDGVILNLNRIRAACGPETSNRLAKYMSITDLSELVRFLFHGNTLETWASIAEIDADAVRTRLKKE